MNKFIVFAIHRMPSKNSQTPEMVGLNDFATIFFIGGFAELLTSPKVPGSLITGVFFFFFFF
jgi:hypothetical protein